MKTKFNVIARCADGDVMIGKDGINEFDWDEAKEIADAHKTLGAEIIIVTAKCEKADLNNKLEVLTEQFNYKVTPQTTEEEIDKLYEQYVRDYVNSLGLGLTTVIMECGDVVVYGDDEYTFTIEEIIENGITQIELEVE